MSGFLEVLNYRLPRPFSPDNEKWSILNELFDNHFQNDHNMLNNDDEDQKLRSVPASFELHDLLTFLSAFIHEHFEVHVTRKENDGSVNDYGKLRKLREAALPVTNAVAHIWFESPGVLEVGHLRVNLETI